MMGPPLGTETTKTQWPCYYDADHKYHFGWTGLSGHCWALRLTRSSPSPLCVQDTFSTLFQVQCEAKQLLGFARFGGTNDHVSYDFSKALDFPGLGPGLVTETSTDVAVIPGGVNIVTFKAGRRWPTLWESGVEGWTEVHERGSNGSCEVIRSIFWCLRI